MNSPAVDHQRIAALERLVADLAATMHAQDAACLCADCYEARKELVRRARVHAEAHSSRP